jgi:hypothetical protein
MTSFDILLQGLQEIFRHYYWFAAFIVVIAALLYALGKISQSWQNQPEEGRYGTAVSGLLASHKIIFFPLLSTILLIFLSDSPLSLFHLSRLSIPPTLTSILLIIFIPIFALGFYYPEEWWPNHIFKSIYDYRSKKPNKKSWEKIRNPVWRIFLTSVIPVIMFLITYILLISTDSLGLLILFIVLDFFLIFRFVELERPHEPNVDIYYKSTTGEKTEKKVEILRFINNGKFCVIDRKPDGRDRDFWSIPSDSIQKIQFLKQKEK